MDFTDQIQRLAEILDLPTAPSDDQVSQIEAVLTEVHDAGYVEGQRHLDEHYGVR